MDYDLWMDAARRYLLPALPGRWQLAGPELIAGDIDWLLRIVSAQESDYEPGFYVEAWVQFLAVPKDTYGYSLGLRLGHGTASGYWDEPADLAGYEPVMAEVAGLIRGEAVPMFDRYGTLDGYLTHLRERMAVLAEKGGEWVDINVDEELAYVSLLRGDLTTAETAAAYADRSAAAEARDPRRADWVFDAHSRVQRVMEVARRDPGQAVEILRENARFSTASVYLPPPTV